MEVEEKNKKKVSATGLYIIVITKQIEYCEKFPSKYGILYDKGYKDGLRKSIKIISILNEEVVKNENRQREGG